MEELIKLLHKFSPLAEPLEEHLRGIIRPYFFPKGRYILRAGEVANYILYLQVGLVRSYSLIRGAQVSNWFMNEGNIVISVRSFLRRQPAHDSHHCLEDSLFWGITWEKLEETYQLYPAFERVGRLITGEYYCRSEDREESQRQQRPPDKYRYMMETDPELVGRVMNDYMASYLDVCPSTYADIRKKYKEKKRRSLR
jgi:CRP-like cAMP-binding protein